VHLTYKTEKRKETSECSQLWEIPRSFEAVVNQRLVVIRLTAGTDSGTLSLPDPLVQLLRSEINILVMRCPLDVQS